MCPHLKERAISLLKEEMVKCERGLSTITSTVAHAQRPTASSTCSSLSSSSSSSINTNSFSTPKRLLLEIYDKPIEIPVKTNIGQELELYTGCHKSFATSEHFFSSYSCIEIIGLFYTI